MTDSAHEIAGSMIIKPFVVHVSGFGFWTYFASSRGKALAKAFSEYRSTFDAVTFKDFLRLARVSPGEPSARFGEPITVGGQPAFYVSHNLQYIQFARPDGDVVMNSHPYDVEPPEARRGTPYYHPEPTP